MFSAYFVHYLRFKGLEKGCSVGKKICESGTFSVRTGIQKGKALDLYTEPLRIKLCRVHPRRFNLYNDNPMFTLIFTLRLQIHQFLPGNQLTRQLQRVT